MATPKLSTARKALARRVERQWSSYSSTRAQGVSTLYDPYYDDAAAMYLFLGCAAFWRGEQARAARDEAKRILRNS